METPQYHLNINITEEYLRAVKPRIYDSEFNWSHIEFSEDKFNNSDMPKKVRPGINTDEHGNKELISFIKLSANDVVLKNLTALWDTGASHTHISRRMQDRYNFPVVSYRNEIWMGGTKKIEVVKVTLHLSRNTSIPVEASISDRLYTDVLIGMDVISKGRLLIDIPKGQTLFTVNHPLPEGRGL